ncbi:MAG: SPOR domain-containing protein [Candidatus Omnitrophica bacterium]|nr:SPOR domain-containing protein [Candidatus Omnitrophota bacterium]
MDKANHSQLELFSHSKLPGAGGVLSQNFFSRIWRYEKSVLIIIGFIIVGVVSFSFGVEKGRSSGISRDSLAIRQATTQPKPQAPPAAQAIIRDQTERAYTIQVASFQTRNLAQKEEQLLKSRGHQTLLLAKSGYIVLCVGKFSDKNTARVLLSELKKRYGDCYIRRL